MHSTVPAEVDHTTRPTGGAIAIGVVSVLIGVFGAMMAPLQLMVGELARSLTGMGFGTFRVWLDLSLHLCLVASGIGTFMLKPWARVLAYSYAAGTIVLNGVGVAVAAPAVASLGAAAFATSVASFAAGCAYPVVLAVYFTRAGVRERFARQRNTKA